MNNRGFAITTILYGILILFMFLLLSMLGILATFRGNLEKLIENTNGTRDIITIKKETVNNFEADEVDTRGLYCVGNECKYISRNEIKNRS